MRSKWPEILIDDLKANTKNAIAMGPFGSRIKAENFVVSGIPVIKGGNLTGDFLNEESYDFLTEDKANELSASNAFRRDIVITHRGTIGQVGIIPDNSNYDRYVVSQSQLKVTLDQNKVNPYFVYYFLRSPMGQQRLLQNTSQVGVPAIAQASTSVKAICVPCPERTMQDSIANFLLLVDNKISLNRKTNETLEQIAQALFKSWFVDFDPVKAKAEGHQLVGMDEKTAALFPDSFEESELGMIPKGWTWQALYDTAEYMNGEAFKDSDFSKGNTGLPIIKIVELKQGISNTTKYTKKNVNDKYLTDDGDVLYSWSGSPETSLEIFKWFGGKGWLNQHIFKLSFTSKKQEYFTYFLLKQMKPILVETAKLKQTTGLGHITVQDMKRIMIPYPTDEILNAFSYYVGYFYEYESILRREIITLTNIRDTLLPKLFSGEINLSEAEEEVGE